MNFKSKMVFFDDIPEPLTPKQWQELYVGKWANESVGLLSTERHRDYIFGVDFGKDPCRCISGLPPVSYE